MEETTVLFDKELRAAVENIVVGGGPFFGDLQCRIAFLPIKFGGLGRSTLRPTDVLVYGWV
ncbi:hypothetical protein A2U01_0092819, partial [Trifolium medium]|nr:hypothetical protein [Trifolium medium]